MSKHVKKISLFISFTLIFWYCKGEKVIKIISEQKKSILFKDNINLGLIVGGKKEGVWRLKVRDTIEFKMRMPNRIIEAWTYCYGFNGKETDQETGIQDYGMRWYLPNIARFPSVDPLIAQYPWYTPYQFAGNIPINAIDLDGTEPFIFITKLDFGTEVAAQIQNSSGVQNSKAFNVIDRKMQELRSKLVGNEGEDFYIRTKTFKDASDAYFPHEFGAFDPKGIDGFGDGRGDGREQYRTRVPALLGKGVYSVEIFEADERTIQLPQGTLSFSIQKGNKGKIDKNELESQSNNLAADIIGKVEADLSAKKSKPLDKAQKEALKGIIKASLMAKAESKSITVKNIYMQVKHSCIENGQSKPTQYGQKILIGHFAY